MFRQLAMGISVALAIVATSCLEPTEVLLQISTDACGDISPVEVLVGEATAPAAQTDRCAADGTVGTLVLVPSARDARIRIRVRAHTKSPLATCDGPMPIECLEVSRSIAFVQHVRLVLPISLDRACIGLACPDQTTCQKGMCVPIAVGPCPNGMCNPLADAGPSDAGTTGGDAAPSCTPPYTTLPVKSRFWRFDEAPGAMSTKEESGSCLPGQVTAPAQIVSGGKCSNALDATGAVKLDCEQDSFANMTNFHVALWFKLAKLEDATLVSKINTASNLGWEIATRATGALWFMAHQGVPQPFVPLATTLQVGQWYRLEVSIAGASGVQKAWLNGNPLSFMASAMTVPMSVGGPVAVGPISALVDELYLFQ